MTGDRQAAGRSTLNAALKAAPAVLHATVTSSADIFSLWYPRFLKWYNRTPREQEIHAELAQATGYEQWSSLANELDETLDLDTWRQNPRHHHYDYRLIAKRLDHLVNVVNEQDIIEIVQLLRSGLVRNYGNITRPSLYNKAWAGTKLNIQEYVNQVISATRLVAEWPTDVDHNNGMTGQTKLDIFHDTRMAFGRTCLVLQGGSIFGLSHLGVVKALFLRGLLPRVIAGTGTGALMAALVAVHTDSELLDFLKGESIDLSAFMDADQDVAPPAEGGWTHGWFDAFYQRFNRFRKTGLVLESHALEKCLRANVGDMTFQEAYNRTKRHLNVVISTSNPAVPELLNHFSAPDVVIWSAAMASNASESSPIQLLCKSKDGTITPWDIPVSTNVKFMEKRELEYAADRARHTPLNRCMELYNVNHFIVSQARPYIAPFISPTLDHSNSPRSLPADVGSWTLKLAAMELQHRFKQIDQIVGVPKFIRRLVLDESVPTPSWTLVPKVQLSDLYQLLGTPNAEQIDHWILRGEQSVWPSVTALQMRCGIEFELNRCYQAVRTRKPFDLVTDADSVQKLAGEKRKRKKLRATQSSFDAASLAVTRYRD